jgi:RNA polymerase sigma-70 factor (ECF subfamily)
VTPTSIEGVETQNELFERAAAEFSAAIARLACAYEPDLDRRQDLLQEIHLALWRSFAIFDGRCSLRTWVYRVAHNTATAQVFRRRGKNPSAFITLEDAEIRTVALNPEESTDRERALERVLALVHQLAPLDRQVMSAYLEDLKADEIADITGLSVSNVWTRIHRIKNLLKRQFNRGTSHVR